MEPKPTDLILRRREAPSRRMAAGSVSLVAVLRDARTSALLRTRLIDASNMIRTSETQYYCSIPDGDDQSAGSESLELMS
jgi:hypothetical protein